VSEISPVPIDPGRSSNLLAALRRASPVRLAVAAIILASLIHFWFADHVELVADEAYYWVWSKHLASSYREKGPAVAWTIALSTRVFGDTAFGVRFFAVVLSAGVGWQLFRLARRLYDDHVALWCLAVGLIMPMFSVGSILMTIDPLSVFSWAWALILFWAALETGRIRHWLALGFVIGLGFLSKFTNGVQLACVAFFLLWSKPHRSLFFSRQTVAMMAAFLVAITPILYWNSQNGWAQLTSLHSRSGVQSSFGIHPQEFFKFVGGELGVISPLLAIGMAVAAFGLIRKQHSELRVRFLLSFFAPLAGIFLFFSLNKAGKENWPAPALITGIILTVVFWRPIMQNSPRWRLALWPALGIPILMTVLVHATDLWKPPAKLDLLRRAQGWHDFAAHVQRARTNHAANILIGSHYSTTSMMQFYLPDHPVTYVPKRERGKSQFDHWPGYEATTNSRALYITQSLNPVSDAVQRDFPKCELVDEFMSLHRGRPMSRFRIYLCTPR
jgi:4-amino-4-deoxy-L-arabinose transferase-like glycosyltransferase